jgi:EmrB/QacA subfamily drug resistance transporter
MLSETPGQRDTLRVASLPGAGQRRRWYALAVLAGSHLLIVLDATVVNVALTDIRTDLGFAPAALQWVITAYVLTFGGLLLLGGRLADRFGRRRVFVAGVVAFGLGSLLAGLADSPGMLVGGRALQGAAAALLAPACLSLLMAVFPEGPARHRALAVYAGVAASGMTIGLILGGVMTQSLSWRWVFWINVPLAVGAVLCARAILPESRAERPEPFDVAGALLATFGLAGLIYGLTRVADPQPGALASVPVLAVSAALLVAFARLQAVRPHALLPTSLLGNPTVLGANLVGLILGAAIYSLFYFVSLFLGGVFGYGPVMVGLAFLPMTIAIAIASATAGKVLGRTGPRPLLIISAVLVVAGLVNLARLTPDSGYLPDLLPTFLLAGAGLGLAFVALTAAAVGAAPARDSGVAAAVFNSGQQIGGALGLAILTAVTTMRSRTSPDAPASTTEVITQGWSLGFLVSAGLMLLGLLIILMMIKKTDPGAQ